MAQLPTSQERSCAKLPKSGAKLHAGTVSHRRAIRWWIQHYKGFTYLMSAAGPLSVYHPNHIFTGCGWDAQSASLLFKQEAPRTILLLGLGGATAARQYRHLFPQARITAIEADSTIIAAARSHFDLDSLDLEVICDRAEAYLERSRRSFDAIIDDAWPVSPNEPRAARDDPDWGRRVLARLQGRGVLSVNVYARHQCARDHARLLNRLRRLFPAVREVGLPGRLTTVLVAGSTLSDGRRARAGIPSTPADCRHALSALTYRTR